MNVTMDINDMECGRSMNPLEIVECVLSGIVIIVVLLFLVAIFRNWNKVRGSFVNLYATNALVISCILSITSLTNTIAGSKINAERTFLNSSGGGYVNATATAGDDFYAFSIAFYFSMTVTESCGILLLCYGARHTYFAQRIGKLLIIPPLQQHSQRDIRCVLQDVWSQEKFRATGLILISWIAPLSLAFAVLAGWQCPNVHLCSVDGGDFLLEGCSVLWTPLKSAYIITTSCAWMIGYALSFGVIILTSKQHFRSFDTQMRNSTTVRTFASLGSAFKGSAILTLLSFFACFPQILMTFIDAAALPGVISSVRNATTFLTYLYLLSQPFIIFVYFSGVKATVMSTLGGCCVYTQRMIPSERDTRMPCSPDVHIGVDEEMLLVDLAWRNTRPAEQASGQDTLNLPQE